MAATRYTKMAYSSADEMVFGTAKQPVSYGFGIKVGAGRVIPELNYAPRPGKEKDPESLRKEYVDYISKDVLNRAVTVGFPDVQLETEWVSQMGNPKMATPVVEGQKAICEKFHEEYGLNCAVRQTIPDQREAEEGYRPGMGGKHAYPEALFGCAEVACENGADVLSCETLGGKELADYAVTNGDITAFLFGVWSQFVDIAKKNKVVAGGDTNCSGANTSMFMAGGYLDNDVQRTFSAVTRAISAARTLVAWECGAAGPDKDCGYEGPIVKAIAGKPTAQEGKNCQCAHCDLQGNLIAQCCDLWSNERPVLARIPRIRVRSDEHRHPARPGEDPQGHVHVRRQVQRTRGLRARLRPRLHGRTGHRRERQRPVPQGQGRRNHRCQHHHEGLRVQGARTDQQAARHPQGHHQEARGPPLKDIIKKLEALPDDTDKFYDYCVKEFKDTVPLYNPKSYDL